MVGAGRPHGELPGGEQLGESVAGGELVLAGVEGLLHPAEEGGGEVVRLAGRIDGTLLGRDIN